MIHSSWPWRKGLRSACAGMLLAGITTATCWSQQATVNTEQALASWLNCEYCEHGELEAIARGGEAIVPSLVTALHDGPSPAARETLRTELEARYEQLVAQSKKNPIAPITATKEEFVRLYMGNFEAQQRVRAAQALAVIGSDRARAALETAAANQAYRDDVRQVGRDSLGKLTR